MAVGSGLNPGPGRECSLKFVGHKVSAVRWVGDRDSNRAAADAFVTGSWENDQSNCLCLFEVPDLHGDPKEAAKMKHSGDVNQIAILDGVHLATASSEGSVRVVSVTRAGRAGDGNGDAGMEVKREWRGLHGGESGPTLSCNTVACATGPSSSVILSGGEDGDVCVLAPEETKPRRRFGGDGGCSVKAAVVVNANEFVIGNERGELRLYDLRIPDAADDSKNCAKSLSSLRDHLGVSCAAGHPGQAHIVATGHERGKVAFWDLRKEKFPVSFYRAHEPKAVNAVSFHPQQPEHFFSCSEGGDVWHWNGAKAATVARANRARNPFGNDPSGVSLGDGSSDWFRNEVVKDHVTQTPLIESSDLPLNSLDVSGRNLVVGGDNESVYVIPNVFL